MMKYGCAWIFPIASGTVVMDPGCRCPRLWKRRQLESRMDARWVRQADDVLLLLLDLLTLRPLVFIPFAIDSVRRVNNLYGIHEHARVIPVDAPVRVLILRYRKGRVVSACGKYPDPTRGFHSRSIRSKLIQTLRVAGDDFFKMGRNHRHAYVRGTH